VAGEQLPVFGLQSSVIMWVLVFTAGVMGAGVLGVVIDRAIYFPLRKKKASNLIFLLASFGVFIFLQNLIQLIYGAQILTIRTGPIKEGHQLSVFGYQLGAVITNIQIIILVVSGLLAIVLFLFIKYAKIGKAMRAVADNSIAASTVGINPERIILISFAIGSALAGAGGILISFETNIEPTMGFNALLKGIIASIVGGIGSLPGSVLGGFFLGLAENLGIWKISAGWKDSIAFAILIIFLIIKPSGIMGKKTEKEHV
jgi:branched-chain amino acid transport system permease protein